MKKIILLLTLLLVMFLSSCLETDIDKLNIELNPSVDTVQIFEIYSDPGATASYGNIDLVPRTIYYDVDTSILGVYEIIYTVEYEGLSKEKVRIVTVVDEIAPEIHLVPGLDTILRYQEWVDMGVTSSDNSKEDPTISVSGYVDQETPGEYIITYTASDASGNQRSVIRYVNVVEPITFPMN